MSDDRKLYLAALKLKRIREKNICYDPLKLGSRPTEKQDEILKDQIHRILYVVAGNQSGKSTLGGRLTAWFFNETHPYWERPNSKHCHHCKSENFEPIENSGGEEEEFRCLDCKKVWCNWGDEPLTLLVSGKVSKMVTELWEKKIKGFLEPGTYRLAKDGNALSSVTHLKNGNKIIFLSHEKAIKSKDKIQSYVAHFVWIDEMPDHYMYLEEAIQRITSKKGKMVVTMTPKTSNPEVRDMIDGVDSRVGRKYQFGKLDNPIFQSPEAVETVMAEVAGLPESARNAVLYGDWMDADDSVFHFDRSKHIHSLPEGYSTSQEHVMAYDPAASGKGGLVMAVRTDAGWHVNKASYTNGGKAYSDLVVDIDRQIAPYTISRKVYDVHETNFILEFNKLKKVPGALQNNDPWLAVKKHSRKLELITNLQQAMLDGWLTFSPELHELFNEFTGAQWNAAQDGIQGSQHFHLLDALQYLIDLLPNKKLFKPKMTRDQQIMQKMQLQAFAPKKKKSKMMVKRRGRR